jgi:osmotically-inducible protein OsmY
MKKNLVWLTVPLLLAVGCAENHRDTSVSYSPALSESVSPTSDRAETRVYPAPPASGADVSTVPAGATPQDWKLAQEIQSLLMSDRTVGKAPVAAVVNNGVVTLRGEVRNKKERARLREEIANLPGVTRVDDQTDFKNPLGIGAGESRNY